MAALLVSLLCAVCGSHRCICMRASVLMLGGRALTSTVLVKELDREEVQQCAVM